MTEGGYLVPVDLLWFLEHRLWGRPLGQEPRKTRVGRWRRERKCARGEHRLFQHRAFDGDVWLCHDCQFVAQVLS